MSCFTKLFLINDMKNINFVLNKWYEKYKLKNGKRIV